MTITTETDLSLQYRVLRVVIRTFRPQLVKPGKPLPSGSPRLPKVPKSKSGVKIKERQECDVWLYDMIPPAFLETARYSKRIYYFSGGAFQSAPTGGHWGLCARLAKNLIQDGYTITLVSYPLAPNTPAVQSLPILQKWLKEVMKNAKDKGETIQLMGDSAGGNIVLSLGFWWAKEANLSSSHTRTETIESSATATNPLTDLIVISPATDLRHENPEMKEADKRDPILTIASTTKVANIWCKGMEKSHPSVSAVLIEPDDFALLRDSGIKIHGVVGTADILAPDALIFQKLCDKYGVSGNWLIWKGQMHCFPLTGAYGITEGKKAIDWIERVLRDNQDKSIDGYNSPDD
jgi:acetyl esterase/lipase